MSAASASTTPPALSVPRPGSERRPFRFSQLDEPIHVPVYLAAMGPRNQALTAELAVGWSPTPYSPDAHASFAADLISALEANGRRRHVQLAPVCPVAIGDDLPALLGLERRWSVFYLAGMGTRTTNFYANAGRRMGYGTMVDEVQDRWFAGDRAAARDAVSDGYADSIGLFGPPARIRERLERYTQVGIDEIVVELRKPDLDDQLQDLRMFWDALHA